MEHTHSAGKLVDATPTVVADAASTLSYGGQVPPESPTTRF